MPQCSVGHVQRTDLLVGDPK